MSSVRSIEAEVSIKSGVQAECTIGREVIVEVHDDVNLETLTATENGSYRPESGVDGWDRVTVAVPERQPVTEPLSVTANGQYTPSQGVDGFSDVTVNVPERIPVTESLSVTENGMYEPDVGVDGYDRVVVDVPPTIPEIETLTVTEDGVYQAGGDGYNPVVVNTGVANFRQEIANAEIISGCSPLIGGITALMTNANEVTGADDETLSDAMETLVAGYGGAETVTVNSTASNTLQCMINIFGAPESGYLYAALLTGKSEETWVSDQFVGGIGLKTSTGSVFYGTSLRYRNSYISQASIALNYDAKVEVGDVFTILKIPYS